MSRSFSPLPAGRPKRRLKHTSPRAKPENPQTPCSTETPTPGFDRPVREYLNYCRIECGFSPSTLLAYESDLSELARSLAHRGQADWRSLAFEDVTTHMRELHTRGLATSSIARHVAAIRVFTRYLESIGYLERDPCEWLTQPTTWQRLPTVLGPEQMRSLLQSPQEEDPFCLRDRAILEILYASGLRATELAELVCQHVHLDLAVVRVMGKGRKERITPVGRKAIDATRQYLTQLRPRLFKAERPTDHVFLSRTGRPLERVAVWQLVKKYAHRAGLAHVHPHTLRHSFATDLLAGGADLRIVQELLGHSNIQTTQVYTHVDRSRLKEMIRKHHPRP